MSERRLTMARALVEYLCAQFVAIDEQEKTLFAGVFAIFGHGNVAGLGGALRAARDRLPTLRAHNEQAMAHAAIGFAKASNRRRMMACTTSIGPGATNMVTAAAVAHVNRLPVMLLPGDTFATRMPDPVLQQLENFGNPNITANDCFKPVSRYWDRITRPEQLLTSLPEAVRVLTDPAECGPVTLALPQDVQTLVFDYPEHFFERRVHRPRRPGPDPAEVDRAAELIERSKQPLIVAGGGVHYAGACEALATFAESCGTPVAETQAGKGSLPWDHECQVGSIGVTGSSAANHLAAEADVVLAIGTRLSDFTTASRSIFSNPDVRLINLNVVAFDAAKHAGCPLVADATRGLEALETRLRHWRAPQAWITTAREAMKAWNADVDGATAASNAPLPSDAQVLGAVNRASKAEDVVVCAAGGLPGELHKLWRTARAGGYHSEYGYSCMGYEIAGGMGVRMARSEGEVYVLVGDGSYLMMNSEIATSVMLGEKLIIVVLDNRGFGCIHRLQQACGGESFNNLFPDGVHLGEHAPIVDFAAHAAAMGARSEKVQGIAELEQALERARAADQTYVIALDTDPLVSTDVGGAWWDVPVPEVSSREAVQTAYALYREAKTTQRI
ncbi:MAG: 3D-(3,5/4)-trihydroxycyclohexane-1,2-dione acylhydrolase (decyclizing) [Gammaproteobacteria bacterium]|nr:MAG: 3D-(3,5/4)-trihydroxycyclohexane-1,2-dione acylhydrolase (decyclizing) [Gammaproteobacteria bacterium]